MLAESSNLTIKLHRPVPAAASSTSSSSAAGGAGSRSRPQLIVSDQPWEDIRFWAYNSLVDNGTHILLYYYVISTGDPALHPAPPPGVTQTYTCLAISTDRGAGQHALLCNAILKC